jgi:O-antigen ligase
MSQFQFIMENPAVAHLTDLVQRRVEQTLEGGDPLSGRGNIWEETLALCAERPLLGYSFEAYSRYSFYDTPHQQYLEVLYKTGGLGLTLYGVMLIAMGLGLWHLARHAPRRSEVDFMIRGVLATLAAALLGNLSQPNLTYSVTGNCLFLMVGLLMNRFGATELTAFAPKPTSGSRTQPLPRPLPGRASSSAEPPGRKAA